VRLFIKNKNSSDQIENPVNITLNNVMFNVSLKVINKNSLALYIDDVNLSKDI
jgi:hypothetical protein